MNITENTSLDDIHESDEYLTELQIDELHLKRENTNTFERDVVNIVTKCIPAKEKSEELFGDDSAITVELDLHKNNDDVIIATFDSFAFKYHIEFKLSSENFRIFCYDTGVIAKSTNIDYILEQAKEL